MKMRLKNWSRATIRGSDIIFAAFCRARPSRRCAPRGLAGRVPGADPGLADPAALAAWLYRIARDKASVQWRERPPERRLDVSGLVEEPSRGNEFRQEDAQEIHASLDLLTTEQREILVLRFLEDMTYKQIAKVTGCSDRHGPIAAVLCQVGPAPGDRTQEIDMNAKYEQSAEKKAIVDALLAIDSRIPTSPAEGREVAKAALRRDRRRVRVLMWMTIGFFLLTVIGICGSVYCYYIKIVPEINKYRQDLSAVEQQLAKQEPQPSKPDLLDMSARLTVWQGQALFTIQTVNLWGIMALFAVMLAAAFCTVLLIMATRRATLRQIQSSLLALSEQFDTLKQSLQGGKSLGDDQATKESSG